MRLEQEIFDDLATLCASPGFIHAIAWICVRDNTIIYIDELNPEDMGPFFSEKRLIPNEVNTLIGLMVQAPLDFIVPRHDVIIGYVEESGKLLGELHRAMIVSDLGGRRRHNINHPEFNLALQVQALREAIFYGDGSAYTFQYRDLASVKYGADAQWLLDNKGIDLPLAVRVSESIGEMRSEKLGKCLNQVKSIEKPILELLGDGVLDCFTFLCSDIASRTGLDVEDVDTLMEHFTQRPTDHANAGFTGINEFNSVEALPLISKGKNEFVLLDFHGLHQTLYESPFYWMVDDDDYLPTAMKHRGEYPENLAFDWLSGAFGTNNVYRNVEIVRDNGTILGEIDVLVIFGDRAIIVQAKSKKLTLDARKGDELQSFKDFKQAIQDAVDQAILCGKLLSEQDIKLRCRDGTRVVQLVPPHVVYPMSLIAESYPGLMAHESRFLKYEATENIIAPLVIEIFSLDVIIEMLASPLRLLSYLEIRAKYGQRFFANHELTLLGCYLTYNLHPTDDADFDLVGEDFSAVIDVPMHVRRDGVSGHRTPEGILTRFENTHFSRLLDAFEKNAEPASVALGIGLLSYDEGNVVEINASISRMLKRAAKSHTRYHMHLSFKSGCPGLTIHCNREPRTVMTDVLRSHCEVRKYNDEADQWVGVGLRPNGSINTVVALDAPWQEDLAMEQRSADFDPR